MLIPAQAQNQTPWPHHHSGPILFILDARNRFERRLLTEWINLHNTEGLNYDLCALVLMDKRLLVRQDVISIITKQTEDTLVVPIRIAWRPQTAAHEKSETHSCQASGARHLYRRRTRHHGKHEGALFEACRS
jgi:hypothetical protein